MRFYGLSEKPFELVSDPDSFYMTSNYREVLGTVTDNLENRSGVILIIGEPGVGKTTLIHYLLNRLDGEVETVFFPFGRVTFEEVLRFLLQGLGLGDRRDKETDLLGQVNDYLSKKVAGDKTLALFIDEAHTFREEVLGELERLLEASRPVQIVLIGQPELEEKLASPQLASLRQKITTQRQIKKLSQRESKEYIDYRLKVVGSSISELFTREAAAMIIAYARGIPRIINVVCDNALLKGYLSARRRVDKAIVREVIRDKESLTCLRVGPTRFFGTLAGLRLELRSYLQMANSATQTTFERAL